jgi:hypothetical protein
MRRRQTDYVRSTASDRYEQAASPLPGPSRRQCGKSLVFLHSHGVGTARAVRIYKTYGPGAIQVMTENPYRLARDIRGIGFKTADAIAIKLGIEKTAMVRVRAGISYALTEAMDEGHCGCRGVKRTGDGAIVEFDRAQHRLHLQGQEHRHQGDQQGTGVRYVLEGSVQRDQNRVRVNAQLIDGETGAHLWADRFEENLADVFKLQDQVVTRLANTLGYELVKAEAQRSTHSNRRGHSSRNLSIVLTLGMTA